MFSQKNKGWRNPWVLALLVIVLSGVMINGLMIWNVTHNPMRLLDDHYSVKDHERGEADWVKEQNARSSLGWQAEMASLDQKPNDPATPPKKRRFMLGANPARFSVSLHDADGKPLTGAEVLITEQWPAKAELDTQVPLHESAPGEYSGMLSFSRPGNWDLRLQVNHSGTLYEKEQRVFVLPAK